MHDWQTRNRLSFHEAGHAVVAHALGSPIFEVSVVPGDGYDGRCVPGRATNGVFQWRGFSIDEIVINVAGGACERIQFDAVGEGSHSDETKACITARGIARSAGFHFCDHPGEEIVRLARTAAEQILRKRWHEVLRVSFALLRYGTIGDNTMPGAPAYERSFYDVIRPLPATLERRRRINEAKRRRRTSRSTISTSTFTADNAPPSMRSLFFAMQTRNDGGFVL
jgi:hypothetical protein